MQEMRIAGCRTLADGDMYLLEKKKKREAEGNVKKARDNTGPLQGSGKATHRLNRSLKRELGDAEPGPGGGAAGETRNNQKVRSGGGHHALTSNTHGKSSKKLATLPDLAGYRGMEMLSLAVSEIFSLYDYLGWYRDRVTVARSKL